MDKLDYKKKYKNLYLPKTEPAFVTVPEILFLQVTGQGDPNCCQEYQDALSLLYGLSYSIKMSKLGNRQPTGYFEYVVPPLEGLWWTQDGTKVCSSVKKDAFQWIFMIRQPEFVTEPVLEAAKEALRKKKPELDSSKAKLVQWTEGECCQILHIGAYDAELATLERLEQYITQNGYAIDDAGERRHHEIYLNDPRHTAPEKLKTVLRLPVRKQKLE